MSAVIFQISPQGGFVATDTLAADTEGVPGYFTSKAIHIPHLKTVVFGTGVGGFMGEWIVALLGGVAVDGIEHLNAWTPEMLRSQWQSFEKRDLIGDESVMCRTATIYHMGVSELTGEIVAFAYRSTTGFRPERLPNGTAVKPECEIPEGGEALDILELMREQRRVQEQTVDSVRERVHIGGEIHLIDINPERCLTFTYARFEDFEQARQVIYQGIEQDRQRAA